MRTDSLIPQAQRFTGYRPYCPYTAGATTAGTWKRPDLRRARRLVARSGARGTRITVLGRPELAGDGEVLVRALDRLGYRASLRPLQSRRGPA